MLYKFLPEASFCPLGVAIACICVRVCVPVCLRVSVCQPRAYPRHNSSPVQARVTKFGPEIRNVKHLGKDPYFGGGAGWLTLAFKVKFNLKLKFRYAQFHH